MVTLSVKDIAANLPEGISLDKRQNNIQSSTVDAAIARLRDAISGGNKEDIRKALLGALKLEGALSMDDPSKGSLDSAVGEAQTIVSGTDDGSAKGAGKTTSGTFEEAITGQFSEPERKYYESFDPQKQYDVQVRGPDGKLTHETRSGQQIRDSLETTKYHALPEEERKNMPKPEGSEREQLDHLKTSLDTLESRRTFELESDHRHGDLNKMSANFDMAREKINHIKQTMDQIEVNTTTGSPELQAMKEALPLKLKTERKELGEILQHKIFEEALELTQKGESKGRFESTEVSQAGGYAHSPQSGDISQLVAQR